ncbi:single-stranded DNA-binding protein [Pseudarthrobacter phenanthrenivorans]|uniref:single-stranded DNA-binding protein n=1 Tax=Pseudarthrobacter phenanthrenivorans TaxID=361575 RepID=UPI00344D2587
MSNVAFKGNVGKVHGLKFNNDGKPRFSFSVAEGHGRYDQNNQWQDTGTTWWAVTVFGRDAETLADTITEGAKLRVAVAGRAQTRDYEANGEKRQSLDVIADYVGIIPAAPRQQPAQPPVQAPYQSQSDPWAAQGHGSAEVPF